MTTPPVMIRLPVLHPLALVDRNLAQVMRPILHNAKRLLRRFLNGPVFVEAMIRRSLRAAGVMSNRSIYWKTRKEGKDRFRRFTQEGEEYPGEFADLRMQHNRQQRVDALDDLRVNLRFNPHHMWDEMNVFYSKPH